MLATASVWGQSKSKVNLVSSTTMRATSGPNGTRTIKVHNGIFKQDYSTLTSDSAYFYPDQNMVDAFGHVVINQGDTVHIYSDKLNYNGNTKIAILTDHVIMVDKDATLTTNNFTYNTATRIGTYVDGGKLVNKDNTVNSKNGYYFAFTRDAYFRYDVVCKTPDAVIKTDTMRYNAGTRINYFYGPTIIEGKDKDNLYTENGTYNTILKQAAFGKKNLYTQKTKSLKGDSLFYDRITGYGRAVKHVTFTDTEQKVTLKGDLGEYFKTKELAVVTQDPYMIMVTEDSTAAKPAPLSRADSLKLANAPKLGKTDSLLKRMPGIGFRKPGDKRLSADSLIKHNKATVDTLNKAVKKLNNGKPLDNKQLQAIKDSAGKQLPAVQKLIAANNNSSANKMTLQAVRDSMTKQLPAAKKILAANTKPSATKKPVIAPPTTKFPNKVIPTFVSVYKYADTMKEVAKPRPNIRYDSLYFVGDTLTTQMITIKDLKILKQHQYDLEHPDTTIKKAPVVKKASAAENAKAAKYIEKEPFVIMIDMAFPYYDYFANWPKPSSAIRVLAKAPVIANVIKKPAVLKKPTVKLTAKDSLAAKQKADSIAAFIKSKELPDTMRVRIVKAYNNAKLFKSDLQAKADSFFYTSSDSTIRMYNKPMIWTQSSQLSGDTINLQLKNKKLDNLDMYPAAFIVNVEKNDSTFFNQAGGKFMHGTFKNSKLNSFDIIGNAETIYFKRDSATNIVTDMSRTQSGKAHFNFVNGEINNNSFAEKYEARGFPIRKTKDDDRILKGFIWKPKDRPASKEAILAHRKPTTTSSSKNTASKPGDIKGTTGKASAKKSGKDTTGAVIKSKGDSVIRKPAGIKAATDTLSKKPVTLNPAKGMTPNPAVPNTKADTGNHQTIKVGRDSTRKDTTAKKPGKS
nr:OstA-like protein [Mucilaginibacter sp. dw_454]